jgi:hypothetical protein
VAGLLLAIPLDLTIWALLKHHVVAPREAGEQEHNPQ